MKTLLTFLFSLLAVTSFAQVNLSALTDCTEVRRISTVKSTIKRPLLSLNNLDNGNNHQKGYDVEYVLNNLSSMSTTINSILDDANNSINENPNATSFMDENSRILQYRAFRSLLTYLRSRNGQDGVTITEINQSLVFDEGQHTNFLTALKQPSSHFLVSENPNGKDDYVKWAQSLANYARAIDLYLAFEIAVMEEAETSNHPELESQLLLTMVEKETLLTNLAKAIITSYGALTYDHSISFGINEDDVESGNRPLKMYAALGYASLVNQDIENALLLNKSSVVSSIGQKLGNVGSITMLAFFQDVREKAKNYTNPNSDKDSRKNKWAYQTNGGQDYWAEGPYYFEYAFREILPYWHAMRIANQVVYGSTDDVFSNTKFLKPIKWLLEITTPDGRIPPIDDSNMRYFRYMNYMNWSSDYVNSNGLANEISGLANYYLTYNNPKDTPERPRRIDKDDNLYLLDLAIPRGTTSQTPSAEYNGPNQKILRYPIGNQIHYVLLNGETGASRSRGEGHEQPDQMNLFYQVEDEVILGDLGYDSAPKFANASYNAYNLNNVMSIYNYNQKYYYDWMDFWYVGLGLSAVLDFFIDYPLEYQNNGGVRSPNIGLEEKYKIAVHNDVDFLTMENSASYSKLKSRINIYRKNQSSATLARNVLFIKDEINSYLIDCNRVERSSSDRYEMRYYLPHTFLYKKKYSTVDDVFYSLTNNLLYPSTNNSNPTQWLSRFSEMQSGITGNSIYFLNDAVEYSADREMHYSTDILKNVTAVEGTQYGFDEDLPNETLNQFSLISRPTKHFTSVAIVAASASITSSPENQIHPSTTTNPYQIWTWDRGNHIDIFYQQSKYDPQYGQTRTVYVDLVKSNLANL